MAKQATKTQAKPPTGQLARSNKAAQAAQHQGRAAPAAKPQSKASVPVVQKPRDVIDPKQLANMPKFMHQYADQGKENIGRDDLEVPRLKLIQGLSKELDAYAELRAGNFFHSASETIFDEPFRAVPIYVDKQYILWRPREMGGGILARAPDGIHWAPGQGEFEVTLDKKDGGKRVTWSTAPTVQESGLAEWGTMNPDDNNSPPAATLMYNFVLAFPDEPDLLPAVLTFQRSSIKMGRRLLTKLKTVRTPLFGTVFTFEAFEDTGRGNKFYNINAIGAGLVDDEGQFNVYRDMYEGFKRKGLNIKDIDTLSEETNETGEREEGERPGTPNY